ncbi:MAG TPA: sugar phosphate isomerase/epimerase family protein [Verrucomicrobiae bacterium]
MKPRPPAESSRDPGSFAPPRSGSVWVGNQTAFSAAHLMEPFEYAVANGFDAFEWFPDKKPGGAGWDESDLDEGRRAEIRQTARFCRMRLSVHAGWAIDPLAAEGGLLLRRDIELARDLGAAVMVVHLRAEAGAAAFAGALLSPLRWAAANGLQLAIENTVSTSPADFNELFAALRALDPPELRHAGMCLDLGHANLCAATRNHYLEFIDQLQPQVPILHLHVHENRGDADTHLPLFTGPAAQDDHGVRGFVERMKRRGFSGSIILEQWPNPPSLLNGARDGLRRLWDAAAGRDQGGAENTIRRVESSNEKR